MLVLIANCVSLDYEKLLISNDIEPAWSHTEGQIVVMGSRAFSELTAANTPTTTAPPEETFSSTSSSPFSNRMILVMTRDTQKTAPIDPQIYKSAQLVPGVYFVSLSEVLQFHRLNSERKIYIAGGLQIFKLFESWTQEIILFRCISICDPNPESHPSQEHILKPPTKEFILSEWSNDKKENSDIGQSQSRMTTTMLHYTFHNRKNTADDLATAEYRYLLLLRRILYSINRGDTTVRPDRTQVGTYSVFGTQMRFDIRTTIPLLTTKRVSFKGVVEELLWILQGHTDAKLLSRRGVKIWDANTSRAFLDQRGLAHYPEGVLGPGYGFQLRFFGATYAPEYADMNRLPGRTTTTEEEHGNYETKETVTARERIGGVDQLAAVERLLREDPFSRRILISMWNPAALEATALAPCHYSIQFYVEEALPGDADRRHWLSCMLTMRSNDLVCGFPWNIASYSVLTWILALRAGMRPKDIVYSCGDAHIYANHVKQVETQILREPRPFPALHIDASVATKDWSKMTGQDFGIIGYFPHAAIPAQMAV